MNYPVLRNCCRRARARALAWHRRARWLRCCRQSEIAIACANGWGGAATANTARSNRRASGSVIPATLFFPQPPLLQGQEPQRQHHQRLVLVPAAPALDLVVPQAQLVLAPQEARSEEHTSEL